jgi:hypothetical protein
MGIFNFKKFLLNEAHGLSKSSIMFADVLQKKTYYKFLEFIESSESALDEKVEIKYRDLARFIDKNLYPDFPVVGFELILEFKKMNTSRFKGLYDYSNHFAIGGYASGFGNKNWKNYSKIVKPARKIADVGLIIQLSVGIDIDKIKFDINNSENKQELIDGINSTLYHELNHCYEHYKRTIKASKRGEYRKPIYDRSFNTALTYAENNKWRFPKEIWHKWTSDFLKYIYFSERQEMNANIQGINYFIDKYPTKDLTEFEIYKIVIKMKYFSADEFYNSLIKTISHYNFKDTDNALLVDCESEHEIADRLKDMWVSVYEKELNDQKGKSIIPINTFKKMSCKQFVDYWGKKFNENGRYLIGKIGKIKTK